MLHHSFPPGLLQTLEQEGHGNTALGTSYAYMPAVPVPAEEIDTLGTIIGMVTMGIEQEIALELVYSTVDYMAYDYMRVNPEGSKVFLDRAKTDFYMSLAGLVEETNEASMGRSLAYYTDHFCLVIILSRDKKLFKVDVSLSIFGYVGAHISAYKLHCTDTNSVSVDLSHSIH